MIETRMWGERGLVATLAIDLGARSGDQGRWSRLLAAAFAERNPEIGWDSIDKIVAVVEPNFGSNHGFGSPDLVIRVEFSSGTVAVVFAEAKCVTYAEASQDPAGRHLKGYNSRINGQIEMNHRLTLALRHSGDRDHLEEPGWCDRRTCYVRGDRRRRVKNPGVMKELVPLVAGPEVLHYLHLAITNDPGDPFDERGTFSFLPVILDEDNRDQFQRDRQRFGWLGWERIEQMAADWDPSLFRPTLELNRHFLHRDPAPICSAGAEPTAAWQPGRPGAGVSLVRIPSLDNTTALHFSWKRNSCAVRNYLHPDLDPSTNPAHPEYQPTTSMVERIADERRFGRARPRREDADGWFELILSQNLEWGLPG